LPPGTQRFVAVDEASMIHLSDLGFMARHGTLWLFSVTLGERLGLPLFVTPLLIAAGALAAMGGANLGLLLLATTVACLAGDMVWYELGRWKGSSLFGLLCRISLQPDSCVRRSQTALAKHTGLSLLWAKWIPGVAHLAVPLAGAARMPRARFHLYNAAGSIVWLAVLLTSGYLSMLTIDWLGLFVITAPWAVAGALAVSLVLAVHSYWKRRQFLKSLRMARISPEELYRQMEAGEAPIIVDLRHPLDFLLAPRTLPNALRISPDEIAERWVEIPAGRDIVVYCTCPNEATAVMVAMRLRKLGINRVRPLAGGLAGWERLGFPMNKRIGDDGQPESSSP
jgi:membrane protein DedA with SNARE-associated domain/rhodanese-related sulfurtransferase